MDFRYFETLQIFISDCLSLQTVKWNLYIPLAHSTDGNISLVDCHDVLGASTAEKAPQISSSGSLSAFSPLNLVP